MEKLQRCIDSTFKSFFSLLLLYNWVSPQMCACTRSAHLYEIAQISMAIVCSYYMVILAWSEQLRPPVPKVCPHIQRSPWAAVCLFSQGLVATAMWLWLTVGLTTPFMRHLLAVNQGGHPGAIDGAVSLCEMCLSKPTHSATLSPCLGSLTFVYCPPSIPSISFSFFHSVCPSPACFPSETCQPLNPRSNHRFFGYTFVILKPSGLLHITSTGLIYMCFLSLLLVFALYANVTNPFSPLFPLTFIYHLLFCCTFAHPSSLWLTGDKFWASSWLANRRPVIPVNSFSEPCQATSGRPRPSCELTKGTEFCSKWRKFSQKTQQCRNFCHLHPSNSPLDMDHP